MVKIMEPGTRYWWTEREADRGNVATVFVRSGEFVRAADGEYQLRKQDSGISHDGSIPAAHTFFATAADADTYALGTACGLILAHLYKTALVVRHDGKPVHIDAIGFDNGH